ncbi:MAG: excinuclease ABC subunit UvrA [Polyangiaceae bacterium]|nr:excinuclease ABC subunit UvrA [Polyangiaceae bacterium]MCW5789545.1 excinuclease ABC subunit UvrA [Polyangiaceae bacterium]
MRITQLRGARTHNLKRVDLDLVPGEVVALTGVSGAGKSSLALETLYAEGQRRYVESFSPYARQFLERLERPPMDSLEPVPAGIAVDRRAQVKSSRSTLATLADLEPYLAALFTRESAPLCPMHHVPARLLTARGAAEELALLLARRPQRDAVLIGFELDCQGKEHYLALRTELAEAGFTRLFIGGEARRLDEVRPSEVGTDLVVVTDRLRAGAAPLPRLTEALELAFSRGQGVAWARVAEEPPMRLGLGLGCARCQAEGTPRVESPPSAGLFSYESPLGACPACKGFGRVIGLDLDKVVPNPHLSLSKGAIRPWAKGKSTTWERRMLRQFCERVGVRLDVAWDQLRESERAQVLDGEGAFTSTKFPGVRGWFRWLETRTYKMHVRVFLSRYRSYDVCGACQGQRLNERALRYRVGGMSLAAWHRLEVEEARERLAALSPQTGQGSLAREELLSRLSYLSRVGLGYLTLDRQARSLSGGETQRVTLTAALGTTLSQALFVLDEPTVGLHSADVEKLAKLIRELADRDNVVVLVEHDEALIAAADRVVELGPGAGDAGGQICGDVRRGEKHTKQARVSVTDVKAKRGSPKVGVADLSAQGGSVQVSVTDASARPLYRATLPAEPTGWLTVRGASEHNLQDIDVRVPLGVVCAVTGPSGSGKSTLVEHVIHRAVVRALGDFTGEVPGAHRGLEGWEQLSRALLVDQAPLGRTSRGNAATYTKAWDRIRALLAASPAALAQQLGAGAFSFNVAGGRCEACKGEGYETVEMQFLADVRLSCPVCGGRRFQPHVLEVTHAGLSVWELLELTVDGALAHFAAERDVQRKLGPVSRLGLGYLRLGQPLSTLSGGEAQRLKLARALCESAKGALFVLDEPSAGLHPSEVALLVRALNDVRRGGGSVLLVDHDLDLISAADWVIDLGEGGGAQGGRVVAAGPPMALERGATARALAGRSRPPERGARQQTQPAPPVLSVTRAREHNLKDVSVEIPHGKLCVVTGPSGSGKSSLAFDVIFAEGQRRFISTLTPYARQFLPTLPRPDVSRVSGVPPVIALSQRTSRAGSKSTVATVTEVAHYLRLLYAKLGVPRCPEHDLPIERQSFEDLRGAARRVRGRFTLLAPAVVSRKGTHLEVFSLASQAGYESAYADGKLCHTDKPPRLAKTREHSIDVVIAQELTGRSLTDELLRQALRFGHGALKLAFDSEADGVEPLLLSERAACPRCQFAVPELDPRFFSFNTQQGRCPRCEGEGVISAAPKVEKRGRRKRGRAPAQQEPIGAEGASTREGPSVVCPACHGERLGPLPRAVRFHGGGRTEPLRLPELMALPVSRAAQLVAKFKLSGDRAKVGEPVLREALRRLEFLVEVGLGYLTLDRAALSLSGGELQRLRLAAQLGSGLTGALYVLDEPTIGLHPKDTERLIGNLKSLVAQGSTALVVEHDADLIRAADYIVDVGPSGGERGGQIVAAGSPSEVLARSDSPTAESLKASPSARVARDLAELSWIQLSGVTQHNLKGVDVSLPCGRLTVVAGVSGSGKSTLVRQVLLPAVRERLAGAGTAREARAVRQGAVRKTSAAREAHEPNVSVAYRELRLAQVRRAVSVDQSPIGRTPRSVPATFLGIFDELRRLFAKAPEAAVRGFDASRFSFNTPRGGRCPACDGQGVVTHEMSFLPDVITRCEACLGMRFEPATLEVRYRGLSVGEVLALSAEEALGVFEHHPKIRAPLEVLVALGAGYIRLGQGSHTLSGGEAQRLKLAAELAQGVRHEPTLYVLDEPTTGLHLSDVGRLIAVLDRLIERGDTLVVIEHHPEVIQSADWVVELGPGGGESGGQVVAQSTPTDLRRAHTATAEVLRALG